MIDLISTSRETCVLHQQMVSWCESWVKYCLKVALKWRKTTRQINLFYLCHEDESLAAGVWTYTENPTGADCFALCWLMKLHLLHPELLLKHSVIAVFKVCLIKWTSFQMWHKQIRVVRSRVKAMKPTVCRTDLDTLELRARILLFAYCSTAVFIPEGEHSCLSCSCMGWPRDARLINCHSNEFWTFTLVCAELTVLIFHKPRRQFDGWIRVAMAVCVM